LVLDLSLVSRQIDAMGSPLAAAHEASGQRLRAALAVLLESTQPLESLRARVEEQQRLAGSLPLAAPLEPLHTARAAPACPPELDVLAVDGSQIDVDRHNFLHCYLINIGAIRLSYGAAPDAALISTPFLHFDEPDLFIADPTNPLRREPVAGALLHARRNVTELRELARAAAALPAGRPAVALVDNSLVLWGLAGRRFDEYVKIALLQEYFAYHAQIQELNQSHPLALAGYISRPDGAQVVNTLRLAVCAPATCRHCLARFAPAEPGCPHLAGLRDRELFARLLRAPGQRSALFQSTGPTVRENAYNRELYFFYLHTGEEIARVELPAWVARSPERLDLAHAALAQQLRHGQGYPQALMEAHEQAVVDGADRAQFWYLIEQMLAERRLAAETSAKALSKRTRAT
jgi:hypothetical protein